MPARMVTGAVLTPPDASGPAPGPQQPPDDSSETIAPPPAGDLVEPPPPPPQMLASVHRRAVSDETLTPMVPSDERLVGAHVASGEWVFDLAKQDTAWRIVNADATIK